MSACNKYLRQYAFILGVLLVFKSAELPLSHNITTIKGDVKIKANY